jgi:hypothetical protein
MASGGRGGGGGMNFQDIFSQYVQFFFSNICLLTSSMFVLKWHDAYAFRSTLINKGLQDLANILLHSSFVMRLGSLLYLDLMFLLLYSDLQCSFRCTLSCPQPFIILILVVPA